MCLEFSPRLWLRPHHQMRAGGPSSALVACISRNRPALYFGVAHRKSITGCHRRPLHPLHVDAYPDQALWSNKSRTYEVFSYNCASSHEFPTIAFLFASRQRYALSGVAQRASRGEGVLVTFTERLLCDFQRPLPKRYGLGTFPLSKRYGNEGGKPRRCALSKSVASNILKFCSWGLKCRRCTPDQKK